MALTLTLLLPAFATAEAQVTEPILEEAGEEIIPAMPW